MASHLNLGNGRRRLERDVYHDVLPVAYPPLYPPAPVRPRPRSAGHRIDVKFVVVLDPREQRPREAIPRLESLRGRYRHARLGKIGLELVEYGRSQSGGYVAYHAGDDAADGIPAFAYDVDPLEHPLGGRTVRTADDVRVHVVHREGVVIDVRRLDLLDLGYVREDLDAVVQSQYLPRDGAGRDATYRLPRRGPSPPRYGAYAVLGVVGRVGVARAVRHVHVVLEVVRRALVLVAHQHGQGGAERDVLGVQPGKYLHAVLLVAWGGDARLAGPTTVEVDLYLLPRYGDAGGAAVEGHAHPAAVGFAPGRDAEDAAEGVAGTHGQGEGRGQRLGGRRHRRGQEEADEGESHGLFAFGEGMSKNYFAYLSFCVGRCWFPHFLPSNVTRGVSLPSSYLPLFDIAFLAKTHTTHSDLSLSNETVQFSINSSIKSSTFSLSVSCRTCLNGNPSQELIKHEASPLAIFHYFCITVRKQTYFRDG